MRSEVSRRETWRVDHADAARSRKRESLVTLSKKAHTHNKILRENFRLKRTVVQTFLQEAPADAAEFQ